MELKAVGKTMDDEMLRIKFMAPLPRECRRFMGMNEPVDIDDAYTQARGWARAEQFGQGDFS